MKKGIALIIIGVLLFGIHLILVTMSAYKYENKYSSYWILADKSSTIDAKSKYINMFIDTLDHGNFYKEFSDNASLFLKTPSTSFDNNLQALKTLGTRLDEISKMDVKSFEYNTAIQQITAQEQGEAAPMLAVFKNCWIIKNYIWAYTWINTSLLCIYFIMCVSGIFIIVLKM